MKYRTKPEIVDAVQYIGANCPKGCEKPSFELVNSADGQYFYVRGDTPHMPTCWMAYDVSAEKPVVSAFESWVQITKVKENSPAYYRKLLPFATYEVRSGERRPITSDDVLFKDYASTERWDPNEVAFPRVYANVQGRRTIVRHGDWVITKENGDVLLCNPDVFASMYEPVDDFPLKECYNKPEGG